MDVVSSCDVLYLFFDALNLLFHSFQRKSVCDIHHSDHTKAASGVDLGRGEWELDPGQRGDHHVQGKEEQGLNLVVVHVTTVSFHDGVFSFFHDLLSQWTDQLVLLADPAPTLLSGTGGEAVVAYTDHNVLVPYLSERHLCDGNVVLGLPFCRIDEEDSVEEGVGDTCSRDWRDLHVKSVDSFALLINHVEYDTDRFCLPRSQMLKIVFSLNVITSCSIESWIIHQLNYHTHIIR